MEAANALSRIIAILLSRLKMNVDDCISELEAIEETVFGQRSLGNLRSLPMFVGEKYDHKVLERKIQKIVSERHRYYDQSLQSNAFLFDDGGCKT